MSTTFSQYAHTVFPDKLDDTTAHPLMSDVTSTLATAATNYATYVAAGNATKAAQVLSENPALVNCIFNADKYNWMRDAIYAIEATYKRDLAQVISDASQRVG